MAKQQMSLSTFNKRLARQAGEGFNKAKKEKPKERGGDRDDLPAGIRNGVAYPTKISYGVSARTKNLWISVTCKAVDPESFTDVDTKVDGKVAGRTFNMLYNIADKKDGKGEVTKTAADVLADFVNDMMLIGANITEDSSIDDVVPAVEALYEDGAKTYFLFKTDRYTFGKGKDERSFFRYTPQGIAPEDYEPGADLSDDEESDDPGEDDPDDDLEDDEEGEEETDEEEEDDEEEEEDEDDAEEDGEGEEEEWEPAVDEVYGYKKGPKSKAIAMVVKSVNKKSRTVSLYEYDDESQVYSRVAWDRLEDWED